MSRYRALSIFVVVIPMLIVAQSFHTRTTVFPEGAALTFGCWVQGNKKWCMSKWQLALLPSLAAILGVVMVDAGIPRLISIPLVLTAIVLALKLLDSALFPVISAGVLPLVFRIDAIWYPITVVLVSLVLTLGLILQDHFKQKDASQQSGGESDRLPQKVKDRVSSARGMAPWYTVISFLVISLMWLGSASLWLPISALAPPLLVSFYDWLNNPKKSANLMGRRVIAVVGITIFSELLIHTFSLTIAMSISVILAYVVMTLLKCPHPPLLSISLLPAISVELGGIPFVLGVTTAFVIFHGVGLVLPKNLSELTQVLHIAKRTSTA